MNLRFLRDVPIALRISVVLYFLHVLLQAKVALSELSAFWALLFLCWSVARREEGSRFSFHILYVPLLLYAIASSVSAIVTSAGVHQLADGITWFKILIFPGALILFRLVPRAREAALYCQVIFAVGIAVIGMFQFFALGYTDIEHRIRGLSTHVMTYSGLLLPASVLFLVLVLHRRNPWLFGGAAVIVTSAILLTFTRSVWVGWAAAVGSILVMRRWRWIPAVAALALLFVSFMPEPLFARLASTFDVQQSSNLDRIRMAEAGIDMIKDFPTFGVGPANVKEVYPLYRRGDAPRFRTPHLHNNVIQIWAERGVVALAAYFLLLGLFLRECIRGLSGPEAAFAEGGIAVAVALAVAGLFEFNFGDTEVFYLTLEMFALCVAMLERPGGLPTNEPAGSAVPQGLEPVPTGS